MNCILLSDILNYFLLLLIMIELFNNEITLKKFTGLWCVWLFDQF